MLEGRRNRCAEAEPSFGSRQFATCVHRLPCPHQASTEDCNILNERRCRKEWSSLKECHAVVRCADYSPTRTEITEAIRRFDRGEVTRDELPRMVVQIANELADLVHLSGSVVAGLLSRPRVSGVNGSLKGVANDASRNTQTERLALRVAEAA